MWTIVSAGQLVRDVFPRPDVAVGRKVGACDFCMKWGHAIAFNGIQCYRLAHGGMSSLLTVTLVLYDVCNLYLHT